VKRKLNVVIAGSNGMVGSSIYNYLLSSDKYFPVECSRSVVDLTHYFDIDNFLKLTQPDIVINCAAKVGGINANNSYPADFIRENLEINLNLIKASYNNGVERFINLGSSCIYPRDSQQPLREEYLLTGPLEKTNDAYALAKIAGLEMCRHYRNQYGVYYHSIMPTNLYGKNDNYHLQDSHVLPALIRKCHEAKVLGMSAVQMWGTGKARREFLHADDVASAVLFLLGKENLPDVINIGTGSDLTIGDLAEKIKSVVGFKGNFLYNTDMPDGTPVKRLDMSIMNSLGWKPSISLSRGLKSTYKDFLLRLENKNLRGLA
jgi:GDP-L-fucose synthase